MTLAPQEIELVCQLVDDLAGIQWDAEKTYLIESRLGKLLEDQGGINLTELVTRVRRGDTGLRTAVVDAVTTRETLFFRDDAPFSALRNKALPEIIDTRSKTAFPRRLRLWSAACSSGQEPYSLGITLCELIDDIDDWDVVITATDLSAAAIETASRGVYSDFEMSRGVSPEIRDRYFRQTARGWQISDRVRSLVSFQQRNLLEPYTNLGPFDVIFCRNVAIYFDIPVKIDLFKRLSQVLAPHGAIFVGGSETLSFMGDRWKPQHHCRGVYYQPHIADRNIRNAQTVSALSHGPAATSPGKQLTKSAITKSQSRPSVIRKHPARSKPVRATTSAVLQATVKREAVTPTRHKIEATKRPAASTARETQGVKRRLIATSTTETRSASSVLKKPVIQARTILTCLKSSTLTTAVKSGGASRIMPLGQNKKNESPRVISKGVTEKKPLAVRPSRTSLARVSPIRRLPILETMTSSASQGNVAKNASLHSKVSDVKTYKRIDTRANENSQK